MNRRHFITSAAALPWAITGCAHRSQLTRDWTRLAPLPDSLGVAGPFAGVSGDSLLVAGGANFPNGLPWEGGKKVWHDTVYRLAAPDGRWTIAGKLQRPLAYGVSVSTPDGLVCIGGSDATQHYPGTFRLFLKGDALRVEPLSSLPKPIANATGALVGSHILLFGGSTKPGEKTALNQLWALDLNRLSAGWKELPALPAAPRFLATAASHANDFYVFGGISVSEASPVAARVYLRDAWRYRWNSGWQRLADLPRPMAAAPSPAPVTGSEIVILPGDDGSLAGFQPTTKHPGFSRRTLAYDIPLNQWREGGKVPFAQVTTPCVRWQRRLVIPSGEIRPGVRSPEVWSLPIS